MGKELTITFILTVALLIYLRCIYLGAHYSDDQLDTERNVTSFLPVSLPANRWAKTSVCLSLFGTVGHTKIVRSLREELCLLNSFYISDPLYITGVP